MPLKENKKVTVEQLLQLKKQEKPDSEFWNGFEASFEKRRLRALVEQPSTWERIHKVLLKSAFLFVPAAAAFVFSTSFVMQTNSVEPTNLRTTTESNSTQNSLDNMGISNEAVASDNLNLSNLEMSGSRFVLDNLDSTTAETRFRKVLYNTSLSTGTNNSKAQYVDNPITQSNTPYRVSPAIIKAGYHF